MEDSDTAETNTTITEDREEETEAASKQVFISYEFESSAMAQLIKERLTAAGCNVNMVDEEDEHGSVLDDVATDIDKSDAVLLCLTEKYRENPNCRAHAEYAHGIEKSIIPLQVDPDYYPDSWLEPVCGESPIFDVSNEEEHEMSFKALVSCLADLGLVTSAETNEVNDEYMMLFKKFDKDGNGSIDPKELGDALRFMGCNPTNPEIDAILREADEKVNGNGRLEFNEFCEIVDKHKKSTDEEEKELLEAFKLFDKNGDGTIDREELKKTIHSVGVWEGMSEQEIDEMMDAADTDHSGRIEYNELVRVIVGR